MGKDRGRRATTGVIALSILLSTATSAPGQAPVPPTPPAPPPGLERPMGSVLTPPPPPDYRQLEPAVIARFQPLYIKRGSPRIAVYWNRQFTDRLSHWVTDERLVVSTQTGALFEHQSPSATASVRTGASSEHVTERQRAVHDPQRASP